ncbi:MAG: site-specific integrase [Candidatus Gastranaerophilales bacterium]|nr:site-specific integrase [Candidatus Gastranaerophilales bacterium]
MAVINERKDKNGKPTYQVIIRIKGYPTQCVTFKRKTDAKIWAQQTETEMRQGKYFKTIEAKKHTLADLIERYIKNDLHQRKSDQKKFETQLNWWKDKLGSYYLIDITPSLLGEYRDILLKEPSPKKNKKGETFRSNATVNRYMAALSIALTKATREWEWLNENPMFKVDKKREKKGRTRFLSQEEQKAILKACQQQKNSYILLLVIIALSTGARLSEILTLKWKNVDFERKRIHLMDTKNGENRTVPISSITYDLLKKYSKIRKINSDLVFAREDGTKPMDLRFQWENVLKNAKVSDFTFHDLRHTAASNLAMGGASLLEIAQILGHKTMAMVQRYSHLTEQHTADILERMNEKQFAGFEI